MSGDNIGKAPILEETDTVLEQNEWSQCAGFLEDKLYDIKKTRSLFPCPDSPDSVDFLIEWGLELDKQIEQVGKWIRMCKEMSGETIP